jgi:hypothetical protein
MIGSRPRGRIRPHQSCLGLPENHSAVSGVPRSLERSVRVTHIRKIRRRNTMSRSVGEGAPDPWQRQAGIGWRQHICSLTPPNRTAGDDVFRHKRKLTMTGNPTFAKPRRIRLYVPLGTLAIITMVAGCGPQLNTPGAGRCAFEVEAT